MKKILIAILTVSVAGTVFLAHELFFNSPPAKQSQHSSREKSRSEALEMLQWMNKTRAYPNVDIPANAYSNAMTQQRARFGDQQSLAVGNWTSIGPTNIGGRTLCVALDPGDTNTVWLGSASGGLWKSSTGGLGVNAWTYVPTGYPVIGVSTVAINPQNANEMYIGTGETYNHGTAANGLTDRTTRGMYGMGILKSTDGGATWAPSLNWTYQQQRGIWEIVINPLRPSTVFAATTEGVYKSTDAGATWTQVLNVPVCMDLALHETDTTVILCGAGNINSANKGLYRSTNGGLTWALAGNGFPNTAHTGRITVSTYTTNNDTMIAQLCDIFNTVGIYKSYDKGFSWFFVSGYDVGGYQGWYAKGMAFRPGEPDDILAGGIYMHRSTNGGSTFMQTGGNSIHPDMHDIIVNPLNPYSVYIATDGGLFRSWDFGNTYFECTDGYVTSQCYIGSVSQTNPDFALTGLQDNYSIRYDGFPYWTPVMGGDGCYNAIDPTDDTYSYVAYQYLNVFQSSDQGQSYFQVLYNPSTAQGGNPAAFLAPYIICPSNTFRLYAGSDALQRSDDMGWTWPVVSPQPVDNGNYVLSIAVSSTNEDSVYFATAPDFSPMKFFLSADGGATLNDRSTGLPDRFPRRIAVDPRNSQIVYVVFSGFGTGHVFKSTNAGVTWTDIGTTLPDVPFHCVMLDPQYPDIVYAGSDMGLYVSTDGGATWNTHNTGLHDWTMVFDLAACAADRSLYCFTHGSGVWKRSLDDVLGVESAAGAGAFAFSIFPNPANEMTTIMFSETNGPVELSVYDLQGKLMVTEKISPANSQAMRIDVSGWPAGCYIAEAVEGKKKAVKKVLVAH